MDDTAMEFTCARCSPPPRTNVPFPRTAPIARVSPTKQRWSWIGRWKMDIILVADSHATLLVVAEVRVWDMFIL